MSTEPDMLTHLLHLRLLLALVGSVYVGACSRGVHVSLVAPAEWAGATVKVDGREVGRLDLVPSKGVDERRTAAVAMFFVPRGRHSLTVEKYGFVPYTRELNYGGGSGEDYLVLSELPTAS